MEFGKETFLVIFNVGDKKSFVSFESKDLAEVTAGALIDSYKEAGVKPPTIEGIVIKHFSNPLEVMNFIADVCGREIVELDINSFEKGIA